MDVPSVGLSSDTPLLGASFFARNLPLSFLILQTKRYTHLYFMPTGKSLKPPENITALFHRTSVNLDFFDFRRICIHFLQPAPYRFFQDVRTLDLSSMKSFDDIPLDPLSAVFNAIST